MGVIIILIIISIIIHFSGWKMLILPECTQLLYLGRVRTSGEVWGGRGGGVGRVFNWVGWIVALHAAQGSKVRTWADYSYNKQFGLTWSLISSKICTNFDVFFPRSCLQRDKTRRPIIHPATANKGDENPKGLMPGGSSPNFICSHVPMEIFLFYKMGKKWGN